jgi:hypothetical protein
MTDTFTNPGASNQARSAIFAQHGHLRARIAQTVDIATDVAATVRSIDVLREAAQDLYVALDEHMRFEEDLLSTALADVVGWGAALHKEVEEEHGRQRSSLASAIAALVPGQLTPHELAGSVLAQTTLLLADIEREERALMTAEVDALIADGAGG